MGRLELEVKILDIDEIDFRRKLENMGAKLKEEVNQILYTYDLPTIYGRYIDILTQLQEYESDIKYETALSKLELLFFELENLLDESETKKLVNVIGQTTLKELVKKDNLLEIISSKQFHSFMKRYKNNNKKWIRLRQTNDRVTLAVKHILAPNNTNIQQMLENEIDVKSIEETNSLLEALGFSYKSYQEKRRTTYILDNYEIDIDSWPGIPTYFEVEGKDEQDLENLLNKLGYKMSDAVSCTADQVYEIYGKSQFDKREIRFKDSK